MNKSLLIISGVVIAAAFIAIDFDGLSQSANVASSTSEMFLEDGNNEATGSSTMPIDVIATTSATQEATTTASTTSNSAVVDQLAEHTEIIPTIVESVPVTENPSVTEERWYPQMPSDCFTEEAMTQFGHPGMCLRFFHQGF